jgi:hypothetical protein
LIQETIVAAIGLIAANIAFLVGYLAYIIPETEKCIEKRKAILNSRLKEKVSGKSRDQTFEELFASAFGTMLNYVAEEHKIKKWKNTFSQIKNYMLFSIILSLATIFTSFISSNVSWISNFPFSEVFLLAAIIYFAASIFYSLNHRNELHKWKMSKGI